MILSAAISVVATIGGAISSAISTIGPAVSSFATKVAPVLGAIIDTIQPIATFIVRFASTLLQSIGILKPDEKLDDLGERALQAADSGITPSSCKNFDEYMDKLRNFDLDPEVAAKRSPTEKLVAGLAIGTIGTEDKFNAERGSLNGMWLLPIASPSYFTPERVESLISTGRLGGNILEYLEKRLSDGEARSFEKKLELGEDGKTMPATNIDQLYEGLDSARNEWPKIQKQLDQ